MAELNYFDPPDPGANRAADLPSNGGPPMSEEEYQRLAMNALRKNRPAPGSFEEAYQQRAGGVLDPIEDVLGKSEREEEENFARGGGTKFGPPSHIISIDDQRGLTPGRAALQADYLRSRGAYEGPGWPTDPRLASSTMARALGIEDIRPLLDRIQAEHAKQVAREAELARQKEAGRKPTTMY